MRRESKWYTAKKNQFRGEKGSNRGNEAHTQKRDKGSIHQEEITTKNIRTK